MNASAKVWAMVSLLGLLIACGEDKKTSRVEDSTSLALPAGICGNGEVEAGEACDDGNIDREVCDYGLPSCTVCDSNCQTVDGETTFCGDGIVEGAQNEACDDGNTVTEACEYGETICTICDASCQLTNGATSYCGDGLFDAASGEACDDGFIDACGTCNSDCSGPGEGVSCGDGVVCAETETCDDGNTVDADGCDSSCRETGCGSGVVTEGELCDDGNIEDWDSCSADCQKITDITEFDICSPDGSFQSNCEGYTHCVPWEGQNICIKPCEGETDTTSCPAASACAGLPFGTNDVRYYCLPLVAARDQPCLSSLELCAPGEGTCMSTSYSSVDGATDFRCKVTCDGISIGEQGECPSDELCARNSAGYVDVLRDGNDQYVACTGELDGECGLQHECLNFANGAKYCAKWLGWCGTITPLCGQFDYYGIVDCINNNACDDRTDHKICGFEEGVENPANASCLNFGSGSACVGVCEEEEMTLNCGEGYLCRQPPAGQAIYYKLEEDGPEPCATDEDCAEGNICQYFNVGYRCGRPLKMCFYQDAEFETCEFLEDGNDTCETGLDCLSVNGADPKCMRSCSVGEGGGCGENTCLEVEVSAGETQALCLEANALRDSVCRTNFLACADGAGDCVPTSLSADGYPQEYRCKTRCDVANLGSQGGCSDGEKCFIEPIEADPASPAGWCGVGVGVCGRSDAQGLAECVANSPCNTTSDHQFCESESTGTTPDSAVQCIEVTGGSVCVAQCETEGADTTCGDDFVCEAPASGLALLSEIQENSPEGCNSNDVCDEAGGYTCYQVGLTTACARPLRVCQGRDPICGDSVPELGEECDDGNVTNGDGCDNNCTYTACGNGLVTTGEECDTAGNSAACDGDCTSATCGDGYANSASGEYCDDAGYSATCDDDCSPVVCGDGKTNAAAGEVCDDSNIINPNDRCSSNCDSINMGAGVFSNRNLRGWDFRDQDVSGTNFTGSYFDGAILDGLNLRGCDFTLAYELSTGSWSNAYYDASTIWPDSFDPTQVANLYFIGANADLTNANLSSANLEGANLRGANLTGALVDGAIWSNAYYDGATQFPAGFDTAAISDLHMIGPGVDLSGASLVNADLSNADLTGANLSNADLTGADLAGAVLLDVIWNNTVCPSGQLSESSGGLCAG